MNSLFAKFQTHIVAATQTTLWLNASECTVYCTSMGFETIISGLDTYNFCQSMFDSFEGAAPLTLGLHSSINVVS